MEPIIGFPIEESLEPLTRYFRFRKGINEITKSKPVILIDLGCGPNISFYRYAKKKGVNFRQYIGIDPRININTINRFKNKEVKLIKKSLKKFIPLSEESADYIVGFAFLEHIEYPEEILNQSLKILKKNGKVIFTVPSIKAKKILEFLAFKLNLISKREIKEHKSYLDKERVMNLVNRLKYKSKFFHEYFEFKLNNFLVLEKK